MHIRLVVADQSEARFYDVPGPHNAVELVGRLADPLAHLHDRDLVSDRPGRKFDRAPLIAGRRGATAHHATGGEQSPRRHEAEVFARRVAAQLEQAHRRGDFKRLIVMSGPMFLGLLRQALPAWMRAAIVAEVAKDLVHEDVEAIIRHLPHLPGAHPGSS